MIEVEGQSIDYEKQIRFAAAGALNAVAREGQRASITAIEQTFTTRNPWYLPSNRFGIHTTQATRENLQSAVHTNAYWLKPHETGGLKEPISGNDIAIPTRNLRENPRDTIPSHLRPRNLRDAFVLATDKGKKLFGRVGGQLKALYLLRRRVRIRQQSTVIQPVVKTFENRFPKLFQERLENAIRSAKP